MGPRTPGDGLLYQLSYLPGQLCQGSRAQVYNTTCVGIASVEEERIIYYNLAVTSAVKVVQQSRVRADWVSWPAIKSRYLRKACYKLGIAVGITVFVITGHCAHVQVNTNSLSFQPPLRFNPGYTTDVNNVPHVDGRCWWTTWWHRTRRHSEISSQDWLLDWLLVSPISSPLPNRCIHTYIHTYIYVQLLWLACTLCSRLVLVLLCTMWPSIICSHVATSWFLRNTCSVLILGWLLLIHWYSHKPLTYS